MPTYTQFLDPVTREPNSRNNVVDKEVAEAFGEPFSDSNFCIAMQILEMLGISVLSRAKNGASFATAELVDDFFRAHPDDYTPEHQILYKKFLCERFVFTAWYQPR